MKFGGLFEDAAATAEVIQRRVRWKIRWTGYIGVGPTFNVSATVAVTMCRISVWNRGHKECMEIYLQFPDTSSLNGT